MEKLYRYTPGLVVLLSLLLFMGLRSPERPWDRIINSDGKGYYAYLPAIFIYHDLQYNFVEQYEYQYYPGNKSVFKEFRQQSGDRYVNKYFPGMAVIWLPFFLLGHLMALLEIFPRDGYSLPYQYSILFATFLFLWLGARWLMRLLRIWGATLKQAAFLTLVMTLGTNLLYFAVIESTMTHVYSFALITGFLLATHNLFHNYHGKWLVKSLLTIILIVMIRPTNLMILLLVPFIAGSNAAIVSGARKVVGDRNAMIRAAIQALILIMVPFVLWYLQTGRPVVYTYGSEKLDLLHPHILSILFSFNRGWFVYTPVALVAFAGFFALYRENRFRFWWLAGFMLVFIYVLSCWWVWYYASKFGQRVFVDIYALTALLLFYTYRLMSSKFLKTGFTVLLVLLSIGNLIQFYQHVKWIFPPYNITPEIYCDAFTSFSRTAKVYIPAEGVVSARKFSNDMEKESGPPWMNTLTRNDTVFHEGRWSSKTDKKNPFSVGIEAGLDSLFTTKNRLIRVQAMVFAPKEVTDGTLVVDYQVAGKSLSYNQFILEEFVIPDKWTPVEVAFHAPADFPENGSVKVYFFNPSPLYRLYVDDLLIDFMSLKDDPEYRKIEGALLPEAIKR